MLKEEDNTAGRESRSFPRVNTQLTELGGLIGELWDHVRAVSHIVGIPTPDGLSPSPRPGESSAPMVWIFEEFHDLKDWVRKINKGLDAPLRELLPEFYKEMDDEKTAKKKPSEV